VAPWRHPRRRRRTSRSSRRSAQKCENRAALRVKLRDAFKTERQKENVLRLDPGKRQELAKPILDRAVADGQIPAKARDRILRRVGTKRP